MGIGRREDWESSQRSSPERWRPKSPLGISKENYEWADDVRDQRSAGGIRVETVTSWAPTAPADPALGPVPPASLLDAAGQVCELRVMVQEGEVDLADGSIAMLRDDDLCDALLS